MSMVRGIAAEVERHNAEMRRLVSAFRARIESLPDNPRIRRLGQNCFVGSFSDMGRSWSAEHHDFKAQYRHLSEIVGRSPERAVQLVRDAVESESIRVGDSGRRFTVALHPDVVGHLRQLLEET